MSGPRFFCARSAHRGVRVESEAETGVSVDFWQVLPAAFALVLIIEGLLPFLSPVRWRAMLAAVDELEDNVIRGVGLGSMLIGVALLYWIN